MTVALNSFISDIIENRSTQLRTFGSATRFLRQHQRTNPKNALRRSPQPRSRQAHRTKDHSHARSLRCLGQRWLRIIHKMWLERTPYNPEFHHLNQVRHGSWVFLPVIPNRLCRCIGDRATFDRGSEEIESCAFTVTPGQRIPQSASAQSEGSMVIYYLIISAAKGVAG